MTDTSALSSVSPSLHGEEPRASSSWIIITVILIAFARLFTSDFTWWDDQVTIHHNAWYNPPTFETLRHYWTTPELGLYVPITSTVWAALSKLAFVGVPDDYGVKLNPLIFHGTSILLHIASSLFVLRILRRLIRAEWPALSGTLLFALHPVQVETIGWVSGMKDLLCWCFALAALLLYVRRAQGNAADGRSMWRALDLPASLLLMALAILSKPTAMVLPAAMLVIDVLLIRRPWRRSMIALLPFFALTIAGAWLARDAQFVYHVKAAPLWQRPFIVGDGFAFYVRKLFWPQTLTIDYGRMPSVAMASPLAYLWWMLPAAIGVWAITLARRGKCVPLAGLLIAVIGVAPVSGIATFQMQTFSTVTDHYLYFSLAGIGLLFAWALARWPSRGLHVVTIAALAALGVRTNLQTAIWHDSFALFNHAAAMNEKSFLAPNNLAAVHLAKIPSEVEAAEAYADLAYARAPHEFLVLSNYANVKGQLGKMDTAKKAWNECLEIVKSAPHAEGFRANFCAEVATVMVALNELDEAQRWLNEAIAANPEDLNVRNASSLVRRALAARAATQPAAKPSTQP